MHSVLPKLCRPSNCRGFCAVQVNTRMTADLACMPASALAPMLGADWGAGPSHILADIAEAADAAGAGTLEITLDERQHGQESLLLPGLAGFQGPAICITLPGASLIPRLPCLWNDCGFWYQTICVPTAVTHSSTM